MDTTTKYNGSARYRIGGGRWGRYAAMLLVYAGVATASASAQSRPVWQVPGVPMRAVSTYTIFRTDPPPAGTTVSDRIEVDSLMAISGDTVGVWANTRSMIDVLRCPTGANAFAQVRIDGIGTPRIRIRWYLNAQVMHNCPYDSGTARATAYLNGAVNLFIAGASEKYTTVHYAWSNRSFAWASSFFGSAAQTSFTSFAFDTHRLFDDWSFNTVGNSDLRRMQQTGTLKNVVTGYARSLQMSAICDASIPLQRDEDITAQSLYYGEIILSLDGPVADSIRIDEAARPLVDVDTAHKAAGVEESRTAGSALALATAPNPFSASTAISYTLPRAADVTVETFDARGVHVRSLAHDHREMGEQTAVWDGTDDRGSVVPSGVYYCRVTSVDASGRATTETRPVTLIRQ